jgi:hypothetical protein
MDKQPTDKNEGQDDCHKQSSLDETYLLPNDLYSLKKTHEILCSFIVNDSEKDLSSSTLDNELQRHIHRLPIGFDQFIPDAYE